MARNRFVFAAGGFVYHQVYVNNGYFYYSYNNAVVAPVAKVYILRQQPCDAMKAIIARGIANGNIYLYQDPQTGVCTQIVLEDVTK